MAGTPFAFSWEIGSIPSFGHAEATVGIIKKLAEKDAIQPEIRLLAQSLTRDELPYDGLSEVGAIHKFVRDDIRYVRDVRNVETVQSPRLTIRIGSGDCDDKTALAASLLLSIGYKVRYVLARTNPRYRNAYTHVYPEVLIRGLWCAVETIIPGAHLGYRVKSFGPVKREA